MKIIGAWAGHFNKLFLPKKWRKIEVKVLDGVKELLRNCIV